MNEATLRPRWERLLAAAGLSDPDGDLFAVLADAYTRPGRHYHNLRHIEECLDLVPLLPGAGPEHAQIELALWFHDVVYDARSKDNEQRSAEVAREALTRLGASEALIRPVSELILATQHAAPPSTEAARHIVDIDLAILGAPPARFDEYEQAIRAEYAHVSDAAYRHGRSAVLQRFLERASIYSTAAFWDRYEAAARNNLSRSLERLSRQIHP